MDSQGLGCDPVDEMPDRYDWICIVHNRDEVHSVKYVLRDLQFKSFHYRAARLLLAEREFDHVRGGRDALCIWRHHYDESGRTSWCG